MQLWLVALGAVLMWRADVSARRHYPDSGRPGLEAAVALLVGYGLLAGSVVLTFVAGGTVG